MVKVYAKQILATIYFSADIVGITLRNIILQAPREFKYLTWPPKLLSLIQFNIYCNGNGDGINFRGNGINFHY